MSDEIIISGLRVFAHHGVFEHEKRDGQVFTLDLNLSLDLSKACESDNLDDTVNYDEICCVARDAMTSHTYDLIERAAQAVCDAIFAAFPGIERITLTLGKPSAPMSCEVDCAYVKITRSR